jgi:hypothetical protein
MGVTETMPSALRGARAPGRTGGVIAARAGDHGTRPLAARTTAP